MSIRKGRHVVVLTNHNPDVLSGTVGIYRGAKAHGHTVQITGSWLVAGSDRGVTVKETRTIWYPAGQVKAWCPAEPLEQPKI